MAEIPPGSKDERPDLASGRLIFPFAGATLLAALLCLDATSAQTQEKWIARAVSVQGAVEARRTGATAWQPVKLNDTYAPGDTIRVRERSRADLAMLDQSVLRLNANTELTLTRSDFWVQGLLFGMEWRY